MDDSEPLTPEELDFRHDPSVTALGDGRYVVATAATAATGRSRHDRTPPARRPDHAESDGAEPAVRTSTEGGADESGEEASRPDYFVSLAARTDEGTFDARVDGDDIGAVFDSMLRWYARCVAPEDDPAAVLSILFSRSDLSLTVPVADR